MPEPVIFSDFKVTGRSAARDPSLPQLSVEYDGDFSAAADLTLEFTTVNQGQMFGKPRALFLDNSSNPSEVEVTVSGTNFFFTVPAYAEGVFHLESAISSNIRLVTDGGASDKITIVVYNWEVPPQVWYRYGTFNFNEIISVAAFGPDAVGVVPTKPPLFMGVLDSTGHVIGLQLNATGDLPVIAKQTGFWDIRNITGTITLPTGAATEVTLVAAALSLGIMDDWDEGDRAKVNIIAGQVGVAANAGAIDALTQRVTLGSPTITDYSITNMSGVSQDVVGAGNGRNSVFIQALTTNAGIVWLNLAGGVAVVGSGVPLAAGATFTMQPGISNKITGIAATANDDITVYAG